MRSAVIDIGTNSVKLLVGERRGTRLATVHEEARITRIGEGLGNRARLADRAMARTVETVRRFARIARKAGAGRVIAVATAALRQARNGRRFLKLVHERAGVKVQILPVSSEALCSFIGGVSGLQCRWPLLLADIGGGSTELVLGENGVPIGWQSIPSGAVSLTEKFLLHDPPEDSETLSMYEHVYSRLTSGLQAVFRKAMKVAGRRGMSRLAGGARIEATGRLAVAARQLVVVGGTAAALGAILGLGHGDVIRRIELVSLFEKLRRIPVNLRVRKYGLPRGRADIVVAGAAVLIVVAQICGFDRMTISRRGLRHGVLMSMKPA
jgi:exopolyphosphatase/guanosine-5'-triphosphate,3'-diphosphate pyrophosphatase